MSNFLEFSIENKTYDTAEKASGHISTDESAVVNIYYLGRTRTLVVVMRLVRLKMMFERK